MALTLAVITGTRAPALALAGAATLAASSAGMVAAVAVAALRPWRAAGGRAASMLESGPRPLSADR